MVEGMKIVSEQNVKMTEEMKELAMKNADMTATMADLMRQNAEATTQMKISTEYNAEATKRMKELAELNYRITEQSSEATVRMAELAEMNRRQAQSMAYIAYDTKRDSEVMKAVTLVTLIFLPATFVAVRPDPASGIHRSSSFSPRRSLAWDSSKLIRTRSPSPIKAGFTSLSRFRSPASSSEYHLRGLFGQGRRWRSPVVTLLVVGLRKLPVH